MKNQEVKQKHLEMQKELNEILLKNGNPIKDFKFVAVGYLDITEEFEKGEVSANFLLKLKVLWDEGMVLSSLGHHTCEFCGKATSSSEKTLIDRENNIKYLFPKMIFHYIKVHKFKPSDEFIEFVMRS